MSRQAKHRPFDLRQFLHQNRFSVQISARVAGRASNWQTALPENVRYDGEGTIRSRMEFCLATAVPATDGREAWRSNKGNAAPKPDRS
ncbi:hypothetical protein Fuma_04002 [Fuerstiella marisgermanici]|uniref:Uncharacterized protein n=1 Tax=Fuerstiella marisgermanici TaxID=1891926 RepID=A0A1P8WJY3_9PLAN|nr:hypothetical protein Fuma_04002 [Fuerstiella marisgermanici]